MATNPLFSGRSGDLMRMMFQLKGLRHSQTASDKEGAQYDQAFQAAKVPFNAAMNTWNQSNDTWQQANDVFQRQQNTYNSSNQLKDWQRDPNRYQVFLANSSGVPSNTPWVMDRSNGHVTYLTDDQIAWAKNLTGRPSAPTPITAQQPGQPPAFNFNYTVTPAAERVNADKMGAILQSDARQPATPENNKVDEKTPDPLARLNQFMRGGFY